MAAKAPQRPFYNVLWNENKFEHLRKWAKFQMKDKKSWKVDFIQEILWQGDPYGKPRDLCRVHREDTPAHNDEGELTVTRIMIYYTVCVPPYLYK